MEKYTLSLLLQVLPFERKGPLKTSREWQNSMIVHVAQTTNGFNCSVSTEELANSLVGNLNVNFSFRISQTVDLCSQDLTQ